MSRVTIKTKEEIAILREGGKRHAAILREIASMVEPGVRSSALNLKAEELIKESGDKPSFLKYRPRGAKRPYPATLCVSVNDEAVHGIPNESEKILKDGDIVSLDLGLIHKGMYTDMAVTVPVGTISADLQRLIERTKEALMAGIKAAKAGKKISEISSAIEDVAKKNGYGIVTELSGHGVGYAVHEDPYVPNFTGSGQPDPVLKPGMVLAIEPMFDLGTGDVVLDSDDYTYRTTDGSPSAHFEHTVLITDGNAEILTS